MPSKPHPLKVAIAADGRPAYQIAAAAKINPNTVSAIAAGRTVPSEAVKQRLAAELGRSVEELFPTEAVEELVTGVR